MQPIRPCTPKLEKIVGNRTICTSAKKVEAIEG